MKELLIYTDGGCKGNPGVGAWAFVMYENNVLITEKSAGEQFTTNNKMELTAVIEALKASIFFKADKVIINTDSQYVKNGITSWIINWKKNGWRTASKKPVKNKELWIALDSLNASLDVEYRWVKGHAGIELNERCDELVNIEMNKLI